MILAEKGRGFQALRYDLPIYRNKIVRVRQSVSACEITNSSQDDFLGPNGTIDDYVKLKGTGKETVKVL